MWNPTRDSKWITILPDECVGLKTKGIFEAHQSRLRVMQMESA